MLKQFTFDPLKTAVESGFGKRLNKKCPKCGHYTLLMPGSAASLTDLGPDMPMPVACCYPGCGYRNADRSMSEAKLHATAVHQMQVEQTSNYFDHFSVTTDDDDLSKTFSSFEATTPELRKDKLIAERSAKAIAGGKTVHSFLIGDTGVGKTHLAYAAINDIWNRNRKCKIIFLNMFQLSLLHNKSIHDLETRKWFDQLLFQISKADLIVIDDLGREQDNIWNKSIMAVVANDRENKSILITSNIGAFKRYSSQTLDRLKEHSSGYVAMFSNTKSYRTNRKETK